MKNSLIYWGCSFLIILSSCSFDDDGLYVPQTPIAYLLAVDSLDDSKQVLKVADETLSFHAESTWGLGTGKLSDFSGDPEQFWVSTLSPNSLFKLDPLLDATIEEAENLPLEPSFISVGTEHLLISDSAHNLVGFLDFKRQTVDTISGIISPRNALYRSGKFYLAGGNGKLYIILDQTISILNVIELEYEITDIQADARTSILVYSYDEATDTHYETEIGYHSDQIRSQTEPVAYLKSRLSPYLDRPLGKELLSDIRLAEETLFLGEKPRCHDFEVDFLTSTAYYQYQDSIYLFQPLESRILPLIEFDGKFQKAYFLQQ